MRKYEINNTLPYERDMYDKLEYISFSDLVTMITFNKPLNQSADYKYRRIVYFINLLFNRYNRPEIAVKLIEKYWNKLHLQIIYYGREYCKARKCYGLTCKICTTCYPNRKSPIKTRKA